MTPPTKPLGRKAYGSIGHLPTSRLGKGEHHVHEGQARIATVKPRDKHDRVIVTEKLDGSNVAVAKVNGEIIALNRAGWPCVSAPRELHRLFAVWVERNRQRFAEMLCDGEALHGEWLALAHGTLYDLRLREPFVAFDLTETGPKGQRQRIPYGALVDRCFDWDITWARMLFEGGPPRTVAMACHALESRRDHHGTRDGELMEGAVWRVERRGEFDFLAKWVNPGKADGKYLPEQSGGNPIWFWRP